MPEGHDIKEADGTNDRHAARAERLRRKEERRARQEAERTGIAVTLMRFMGGFVMVFFGLTMVAFTAFVLTNLDDPQVQEMGTVRLTVTIVVYVVLAYLGYLSMRKSRAGLIGIGLLTGVGFLGMIYQIYLSGSGPDYDKVRFDLIRDVGPFILAFIFATHAWAAKEWRKLTWRFW